MRMDEMRLDGNAAGGTLRQVFARDVTAALATCVGCGDARPIGALIEYGHAMGAVLRCPGCDTAMIRLTRTPTQLRIDVSGIGLLVIPEDGLVS